ncbi:hypothetical protein M5K25_009137 [Dendrobium thyrsiflorum]|uniref:Uncharacterized protein n=1 Tax=Dendrobium thyrsiflorum TaxID=117978 RepID=A0ABD0VBM5_DENTH
MTPGGNIQTSLANQNRLLFVANRTSSYKPEVPPIPVLNKIVEDLFQAHPLSKRKLKELLGHTPSQVLAGALLGILVAYICCQNIIPI